MTKTNFIINKGLLNGTVTIPPSKSVAHRALICSALSFGKSKISPINNSADMKATISCLQSLGCSVKREGETIFLDSSNMSLIGNEKSNRILDCCESGSTLRFMIPIACAFGGTSKFIGEGRLPQRPLDVFFECLPQQNVTLVKEDVDYLPLLVSGKLSGGDVKIRGDVSSQFITGLLLALPLCQCDSRIILTTQLQSVGYIDITIKVMREFGVIVEKTDYGYFVKGNQKYNSIDYTVEGDWSQVAFFLGASVLGSELTIKGLDKNSLQGDMECLPIFQKMGGNIFWQGDDLIAKGNKLNKVNGVQVDCENIPDIVPIISLVSMASNEKTYLYNAQRLRIKESDRLEACYNIINSLGGNATQTEDSLTVYGNGKVSGGKIDGVNDHRIVMATAIIATIANEEITVTDGQSINKSYPTFVNDFKQLGGKINVINVG